MTRALRWLAPHGAVAALDWARRFRALGQHPLAAWRCALSATARRHLVTSRLELLPPSLLRAPANVVDVGANEGAWLEAVFALRDLGEVHAFEPNPDAFRRLERRFGERPRVRLHQVAAGAGARRAPLNVTGSDDLASLLEPEPLLAEAYTPRRAGVMRQVEVEVDALDRVLPAGLEVDLLKIDVQGYEAEVLAGAAGVLARTRAVLVEMNLRPHYRGESGFGALFDTLTRGFGFVPWGLSAPLRGARGEALWCDVGFVRDGAMPPPEDEEGASG